MQYIVRDTTKIIYFIAFIAFTLHVMKSNSVQVFLGHPVYYSKVDLHFATCGVIDYTAHILKCVQCNEIVPYNEDLNSCKNHIM